MKKMEFIDTFSLSSFIVMLLSPILTFFPLPTTLTSIYFLPSRKKKKRLNVMVVHALPSYGRKLQSPLLLGHLVLIHSTSVSHSLLCILC